MPRIGYHLNAPRLLPGNGRLIKTHEPYRKVYKRAIYLVRDVRDVALSYRKLRAVRGFADEESFEDFLSSFIRGKIAGFGSWQAHVTSWLTARSQGVDILVVRYEDLIDDTVTKLGDMASFLGISVDAARLQEVAANNQPDKMRERKTPYSKERMSAIVGKGKYSDWQTSYSGSEIAVMEPAMPAMRYAGYEV